MQKLMRTNNAGRVFAILISTRWKTCATSDERKKDERERMLKILRTYVTEETRLHSQGNGKTCQDQEGVLQIP